MLISNRHYHDRSHLSCYSDLKFSSNYRCCYSAGILSGSADFSKLFKIIICWLVTPIGAIVLAYFLHRSLRYVLDKTITNITYLNYLYSTGIILAGCYSAYTLGSNNVATVTGVYVGSGFLSAGMASLIGGLSIALGVITYGKKVMITVGKEIAPLDRSLPLLPFWRQHLRFISLLKSASLFLHLRQ